MTFYLIGLGLSLKGVSLESLEILKSCRKIYMETYTVEIPYQIWKLEEKIGKSITPLTRMMVEEEEFVKEGKNQDIALLVYGSPLMATTHISLLNGAIKEKVKYRVIHNASIFDAISETGLQYYKFGKTASMPAWQGNYKPDSFAGIIRDNQKIKAHTLILVDIGMLFKDALNQLTIACKKSKTKLEKIIVCSRLGTEEGKAYYGRVNQFAHHEIYAPFCIIIPSEMHFAEEEFLDKI
ncbi:MAG: diphthine synthase [archaeon]